MQHWMFMLVKSDPEGPQFVVFLSTNLNYLLEDQCLREKHFPGDWAPVTTQNTHLNSTEFFYPFFCSAILQRGVTCFRVHKDLPLENQ